MRKLSLSTLFLFFTVLALAQYTPATVPNTKLVDNSYVSNPDGLIRDETVVQINSILADLENRTTTQVAVVILKSIGDYTDVGFAQELFNLWGIGRSNSNGLLVLVVDSPHMLRLHPGYGLEGPLPDAICKQIERETILPSFKQGNYDEGLINGLNEVAGILTANAEEIKAPAKEPETDSTYQALLWLCGLFFAPMFLITWAIKNNRFSNSKDPSHTDYPQMRVTRATWLIEFGGIPAFILFLFWFVDPDKAGPWGFLTLYIYLEATVVHRLIRERQMIVQLKAQRKYYEITEYLRQSTGHWFTMAIIFPLPFLVYFPFHFIRKAFYRNFPRKCMLCEGSMTKLSEKDDDEYLTEAQRLEEEIKSVNYDVWKCKECGATEASHYLNKDTEYEACPSCGVIAYYLVRNKTVKAATYSASGEGESYYECKACHKSQRKPYSIPQRTHTSSSSSSSSSRSSYSSGSSSSGGSWGGGSSGGGGASSTW